MKGDYEETGIWVLDVTCDFSSGTHADIYLIRKNHMKFYNISPPQTTNENMRKKFQCRTPLQSSNPKSQFSYSNMPFEFCIENPCVCVWGGGGGGGYSSISTQEPAYVILPGDKT